MIRNVVFDWSGVLSNDFEPLYHTIRAVFHELDLAPPTFSHFQDVIDLPFRHCLKKLSGEQPEIPEKFADRARNRRRFDRYFEEFGPPAVMPGAKDALNRLSRMNLRMAVFSSHHQNFVEAENLSFFGRNFFSLVFGSAGDKLNSAPELIRRTGFVPEETLYVGDTVHDVEAGRSVGMRTVSVLTGYHLREKLEAVSPDFLLNSVAELPGLIQNTPSLRGGRPASR